MISPSCRFQGSLKGKARKRIMKVISIHQHPEMSLTFLGSFDIFRYFFIVYLWMLGQILGIFAIREGRIRESEIHGNSPFWIIFVYFGYTNLTKVSVWRLLCNVHLWFTFSETKPLGMGWYAIWGGTLFWPPKYSSYFGTTRSTRKILSFSKSCINCIKLL